MNSYTEMRRIYNLVGVELPHEATVWQPHVCVAAANRMIKASAYIAGARQYNMVLIELYRRLKECAAAESPTGEGMNGCMDGDSI